MLEKEEEGKFNKIYFMLPDQEQSVWYEWLNFSIDAFFGDFVQFYVDSPAGFIIRFNRV